MKLNEYFRDVTKEKGLTTYQLAELIGINQSYISTIFSGKKGIGEGMFVRLCDALELDEDEVREIYADGIAERGHPKVGSVHEHHARPVRRNGIKKVKLTEPKETDPKETDPAQLLIEEMHTFVCELNDRGRTVVMEIMRMLAKQEEFKSEDE